MKALLKIIQDLIARKYCGKLIISFKDGKLQPIIRKEETVHLGSSGLRYELGPSQFEE